MKRRSAPKYTDESALCADFIAKLPPHWTAYAETAGFDILLVATEGTQVGVQAKLRLNLHVIGQALPCLYDKDGPDYLAVLVPEQNDCGVCTALGITIIAADRWDHGFHPMPDDRHSRDWHYRSPEKRCPVPEYVPDVPAGAPSPLRLTEWKVSALKVAAVMELRGYVTRSDFSMFGIDHRRWTQHWLVTGDAPGRFVPGPHYPRFAAQHPVVYPKVRADIAKWLDGAHVEKGKTGTLVGVSA